MLSESPGRGWAGMSSQRERRDGQAQRMLDVGRVVLAPRVIGELRVGRGARPRLVGRGQQQLVPLLNRGSIKWAGRSETSRHTGPSVRSRPAIEKSWSTFLQGLTSTSESCGNELAAKRAHRAKADRIDRRVAAPILDKLAATRRGADRPRSPRARACPTAAFASARETRPDRRAESRSMSASLALSSGRRSSRICWRAAPRS